MGKLYEILGLAQYEAEKKKHTSYWLLIIAPFIMILIIFIFYYGFYR